MKNKYVATAVYDAESFEAIQDAAQVPEALKRTADLIGADANETMVFARQLETVKNVVYETKYASLKGRALVPMSFSAGPNAKYLTYRIWDETAMYSIVGNYATDFPLVSASAREDFIKFFDIGAAYGYSVQDLREAASAGVALDAKLAKAARNSLELGLDDAIALGCPQFKTYGLTNHPNAQLLSAITGNWPSASGEQILADLNYLLTSLMVSSLEIHEFDTVVVSTACYRLLATKLLSVTNASNITVLQAFKAQNPGVSVETWTKLATANAAGTNGRVLVYKKSPEVMEFEMGSEMEVVGPIPQGMFMSFPCKMRIGGLALHQPLCLGYYDGGLV